LTEADAEHFCHSKNFRGHTATMHRNAITSCTMLHSLPEILLFGNESGTEEICREQGFSTSRK